MSDIRLVIFDCDGVLVDSEPIAMRVLLEGLAEIGYAIGEEAAYERFLGRSLANMQAALRAEFGSELPPDRLERMRQRLFEAYRQELTPIDSVAAMLDRLAIRRRRRARWNGCACRSTSRACCPASSPIFSARPWLRTASPRRTCFSTPPSGWRLRQRAAS
jgi:beta-phosphoglucomutase-like phosphatase (HAD superfamily)